MGRIILNELGKKYYRNWLFKDVNDHFDISAGNSYAILGKNGSGKSTLLLLLCQQIAPSKGSVTWEIEGRNIGPSQIHPFYSICSPLLELPEEMNLKEWFVFHHSIKPFIDGIGLNTITDLCGFSNKVLEKPINQFSSGMKQRVKLCMVTLSHSPVIFLDEPTSNLDANGIELYKQLILTYKKSKCIFVASNDPEEYNWIQNRYSVENKTLNLEQ